MTNLSHYDIYVNTSATGIVKAAQAALLEDSGLLVKLGFRYTSEFLAHPKRFPLDPIQLPISEKELQLNCLQGIPGLLDDYLPDDWGKKVLAQLVFYRDRKKLNRHSCVEMLSALSDSRIGAIQWVKKGDKPNFQLGAPISKISQAESAAQSIDDEAVYAQQFDEMSLIYLANAGTGVGGARPKALIFDDKGAYLAKFNRNTKDYYNNARIEMACLTLAEIAGLNVHKGKIVEGINGREVLLLDRFDIDGNYRKHIITVNSLLKNPNTQRDHGEVFRYEDIADLIRKYSSNVHHDLEQLLKMMLFNHGINNTDTHERNFSFIYENNGIQLAPAYDMVPSVSTGEYPVAGYGYHPYPPTCKEIKSKGKIFGLSKPTVIQIAEEVQSALNQWEKVAEETGVSNKDLELVAKKLNR